MKLKPIKPLGAQGPLTIPSWVPTERIRELYQLYKPVVAAAGVALAVLVLFGVLYVRHSREVTRRSSQIYREALNLFNYRVPPPDAEATPVVSSDEEKWTKCQAMFQQIHETYPGSRLAPEALYYVATCRFRLKQYSQSLEAYDLFIARHRRHVLLDPATLGKADCLEQLSRYQDAYTAYRAVMDRDGPLAFEGGIGATRCLLKLTESDSSRWSEAVDILNKLANGKSEAGALAARQLRKLLSDLMPKKGDTAQPSSRPAARAQPAPQPASGSGAAAQPAAGGSPDAGAAAAPAPATAAPKP